jgi:hypothetical protein
MNKRGQKTPLQCFPDVIKYHCAGLTSITIPDGVTGIGEDAFQGCARLISVVISDSSQLTSIGERAFSNCAMPTVNIPAGVTSIGDEAFYRCAGLTSITVPAGVTIIGDGAFSHSAIAEISVPTSAAIIGTGTYSSTSPFMEMPRLRTIVFDHGRTDSTTAERTYPLTPCRH